VKLLLQPSGKKLNNKGLGSLFTTGVVCSREITIASYIMILTSVTYLVIQGPAFEDIHKYGKPISTDDDAINSKIASGENTYSLIGFVLSLVMFVGYLVYMVCL
jgi:hypothetical protein